MKLKDLKPAGTLAQKFGAKCLAYGPAGSGKTPVINTAPRPVMLVTEPGMLSMRGSKVPAFEAFEEKRINEFFDWIEKSNEVKNFDTICLDSVSQFAEICLSEANSRDGRKIYGIMVKAVMKRLTQLFFMKDKHIFLTAKQGKEENLVWDFSTPLPKKNAIIRKVPHFPGNELGVQIPHLYDQIFHVGEGIIPGVQGGERKYFLTKGSNDIYARDRSGTLNEYEPHDLTYIFNKIMA